MEIKTRNYTPEKDAVRGAAKAKALADVIKSKKTAKAKAKDKEILTTLAARHMGHNSDDQQINDENSSDNFESSNTTLEEEDDEENSAVEETETASESTASPEPLTNPPPQISHVATEASKPKQELSARELARNALLAAKKKAEEEGRYFDETEFIIELVESKRREYEAAKQRNIQTTAPTAPTPVQTQCQEEEEQNNISDSTKEEASANENVGVEDFVEEINDEEAEQIEENDLDNERVNDDEEIQAEVAEDADMDAGEIAEADISFTASEQELLAQLDKEQLFEPLYQDLAEEDEEDEEEDDSDMTEQPVVQERIRLAMLSAKKKAIEAGLPFDEATAISIAQDMLLKAAKAKVASQDDELIGSLNESTEYDECSSRHELDTSGKGKTSVSGLPKAAASDGINKDQFRLALVAAKKKAQEDGKPFDETEFTNVYERKKKKEETNAKKIKIDAKAKLHKLSEGNIDMVMRDRARVASVVARRQAEDAGQVFDEDDFMVKYIHNMRKEQAMARGKVVNDPSAKAAKSPAVTGPRTKEMASIFDVKEQRRLAVIAARKHAEETGLDFNEVAFLSRLEHGTPKVTPMDPAKHIQGVLNEVGKFNGRNAFSHSRIEDDDDECTSNERQSSLESTRRIVSEELLAIEALIFGDRREAVGSLMSLSDISLPANTDELPASRPRKPLTLHKTPVTNEEKLKDKARLEEIAAKNRANEVRPDVGSHVVDYAEIVARRAEEEKKRIADELNAKALKEEAARKAAAAHALALAKDQARFNMMLAKRKAAADGLPFDEEAYYAEQRIAKGAVNTIIEATKYGAKQDTLSKDRAILAGISAFKDKELEETGGVFTASNVPVAATDAEQSTTTAAEDDTLDQSTAGMTKRDKIKNKSSKPLNKAEKATEGESAEVESAATPASPSATEPVKKTKTTVVGHRNSPDSAQATDSVPVVMDERQKQIEQARRAALAKQKELQLKKHPVAVSEPVHTQKTEATAAATSAGAKVIESRADAVARAREQARLKAKEKASQKEKLQPKRVVEAPQYEGDADYGQQDGGEDMDEEQEQEHRSIPSEHHSVEEQQQPLEGNGATYDLSSDLEPSVHDLDESVMDAEEVEAMREAEIARQREIEEMRLRAKDSHEGGGEKKKKSKKKKATFWDSLFMCGAEPEVKG